MVILRPNNNMAAGKMSIRFYCYWIWYGISNCRDAEITNWHILLKFGRNIAATRYFHSVQLKSVYSLDFLINLLLSSPSVRYIVVSLPQIFSYIPVLLSSAVRKACVCFEVRPSCPIHALSAHQVPRTTKSWRRKALCSSKKPNVTNLPATPHVCSRHGGQVELFVSKWWIKV